MRLTIYSIRRFLERAGLRVQVPNAATIEAMREAKDVLALKRYSSLGELREQI